MGEEYGFVSPRSSAVARSLLDIAKSLGHEPGVVRTTIGGYYVPINVAKRYEEGLGAQPEDESVVEDAVEAASTPDESWTNADIKEWANAHEVDLGDATKKADMLAAIRETDKEE